MLPVALHQPAAGRRSPCHPRVVEQRSRAHGIRQPGSWWRRPSAPPGAGGRRLLLRPALAAGAGDASRDTVDEAQQQQQQQPATVDQGVEEVVEDVEEAVTDAEAAARVAGGGQEAEVLQEAASNPLEAARDLYEGNRFVRGGVWAAGAFLAGTFLIAVARVAARYNSPLAKRKRTVNKNKELVEGINDLLQAGGRAALTPGALRGLARGAGFTGAEAFRKYLWFLLRERPFNADAVADCVALKAALGLTDEQVAEALRERAQRIYDKYGNVMLEVAGMTKAGVDRKAACRALFSKLLYLQECEELLPQEGAARSLVSVRDVFGATEDDEAKLRIVSLYEVDLGRLEDLATTGEGSDGS